MARSCYEPTSRTQRHGMPCVLPSKRHKASSERMSMSLVIAITTGIALPQLVPLATEIARRTFMFVVDRTTMTHEEHPVAVLDLWREPGRTFRVIPSQMWAVQNNLWLANMDFFEFANAVGYDGIFRG